MKSTSHQKGIENAEKGQKERIAAFSSQTIDYADEEITVAKIGVIFGGEKCICKSQYFLSVWRNK